MDLMRFSAEAPKSVMEALLVHVMLWGRGAGYRRFSLGMAPLSGFERSPVAPLLATGSARSSTSTARRSTASRGCARSRRSSTPEWEPRYLACPGGLALPRVLADVSALIAGGYRRIFMR